MRLIDADKLQKAIPAEEDNITGMGMTYDEMEAYNDGIDEQWKKIVNALAVKAIPVEWIKEKLEKEEYRTFLVDYIEWGNCLRWLLEKWEKENEQNKENTF